MSTPRRASISADKGNLTRTKTVPSAVPVASNATDRSQHAGNAPHEDFHVRDTVSSSDGAKEWLAEVDWRAGSYLYHAPRLLPTTLML
ncbi:hypothetical protein AtubIFM56815_003627 [Aspergillus tubingensis]|uniref:Uncharacterized protein n=1 Tax=Aspergillus tubingensis TaxID=5068 RepID=A0A9W6AVI6_ASPTU|nr:hypothetical protein AtubIFM56815_003627 [Aspergillus tubingensis]